MSGKPRYDIDDRVDFYIATGRAIRQRRDEAHMSQGQVADELRIKRALLAKYELGVTPPPSYVIWKLAHLFNCTTDDLMVDPASGAAA